MGTYHYDEQCCLAQPGHHLLDADYYVGFSDGPAGVDVTASVREDEVIELHSSDMIVRGWNHRVDEFVAAIEKFGNAAEWIPDRSAVIIPPRWLGLGPVHVMFSVARFDEWTECET